ASLKATRPWPDSVERGAAAGVYGPIGQPVRDGEEGALGRADPGTARFTVRAEDLVPGVYELDVFAPPLTGVTATARAALAPVDLAEAGAGGSLEAANPGTATATGRAVVTLVGGERAFEVTGRGVPAETLTVRVREGAARAVSDVQRPREQWSVFTDFGVTEFDSTGQQVGQGAMNYAFGRHGFDVPAGLKGHPMTV